MRYKLLLTLFSLLLMGKMQWSQWSALSEKSQEAIGFFFRQEYHRYLSDVEPDKHSIQRQKCSDVHFIPERGKGNDSDTVYFKVGCRDRRPKTERGA